MRVVDGAGVVVAGIAGSDEAIAERHQLAPRASLRDAVTVMRKLPGVVVCPWARADPAHNATPRSQRVS